MGRRISESLQVDQFDEFERKKIFLFLFCGLPVSRRGLVSERGVLSILNVSIILIDFKGIGVLTAI